MKRIIPAILAVFILGSCALADPVPTPVLTLLPASGDVSGDPGTAVGWGFTLTNSATDYVVLTGSQFSGSQVQGTYVDYLSLPTAPLYVAGPAPESSTIQQTWIPSALLGVGEFDINSTAPPGTEITGNVLLDYSVFSVDPNDPSFDPDTDTLVANATLSDPVQISVTVPEPSSLTMLLMTALLMPLTYLGWRRFMVV